MINHLFTYRLAGFLILIMTALLVIIYPGCKDSGTNPPEEKPEGYQEDIPWPSLADSPWPIYRADPFSRGFSKYLGASSGSITKKIDTVIVHSGIVLDADSNFYVMVTSKLNSDIEGLAAFTIAGELKWLFRISLFNFPSVPAPIVTSSGYIITVSPISGKVMAINKNGDLIWEKDLNDRFAQAGINLTKDGQILIYGYYKSNLYSLNIQGEIIWQINMDVFAGGEFDYLTLTPDSRYLLIPGKYNTNSIYDFDLQNMDIKWNFGFGKPGYALADCNGRTYLLADDSSGHGRIYVLEGNGEITWEYLLQSYSIEDYEPISMDKNGNIYLGMGPLISLDYNGEKRWEYNSQGLRIMSPASVDGLNKIYFVSYENGGYFFCCLNSDGTLVYKTSIDNGSLNYKYYIPVIGYNRNFISMDRGNIIILK